MKTPTSKPCPRPPRYVGEHRRHRAALTPRQVARLVTRNLTRIRRIASRAAVLSAVGYLAVASSATTSSAAYAAGTSTVLAADSVEAVVNNIRAWLVGILVAVATLFLTIGGLRLMWANGDPGEAEKGKAALKSAAIGYALALLAPLIVTVVGGWVK